MEPALVSLTLTEHVWVCVCVWMYCLLYNFHSHQLWLTCSASSLLARLFHNQAEKQQEDEGEREREGGGVWSDHASLPGNQDWGGSLCHIQAYILTLMHQLHREQTGRCSRCNYSSTNASQFLIVHHHRNWFREKHTQEFRHSEIESRDASSNSGTQLVKQASDITQVVILH